MKMEDFLGWTNTVRLETSVPLQPESWLRHDLSCLWNFNLCNKAHTHFVKSHKHNNINTASYRANEQIWGVDKSSLNSWT